MLVTSTFVLLVSSVRIFVEVGKLKIVSSCHCFFLKEVPTFAGNTVELPSCAWISLLVAVCQQTGAGTPH